MKNFDRVVASKGKKKLEFELGKKVSKETKEEVLGVIVGRSGNLRAPAFQIGMTLVVGYHEEAYDELFQS